jgi:hypothetical protein
MMTTAHMISLVEKRGALAGVILRHDADSIERSPDASHNSNSPAWPKENAGAERERIITLPPVFALLWKAE